MISSKSEIQLDLLGSGSDKKRFIPIIPAVKRRFNIMVVGESGLGKTTFLHALLRRYVSVYFQDPKQLLKKTVEIVEIGQFDIVDATNRQALEVHVHDTPGYGEYLNNVGCISKVYKNVLGRHFSRQKQDVHRMSESEWNSRDERIHCLFYFINSHRMRQIDKEFIEKLCSIVPIIPVIAKADMMTVDERNRHVEMVYSTLNEVSIKLGKSCIYKFAEFTEEAMLSQLPSESVTEQCRYLSEGGLTPELTHSSTSMNQSKSASPEVSAVSVPFQSAINTDNHSCDLLQEAVQLDKTSSQVYRHSREASPESLQSCSDDNGNENVILKEVISVATNGPESTHREVYAELRISSQSVTATAVSMVKRYPNIFCVVCALTEERVYPWGTLRIDDMNHSDFRLLQLLIFEQVQNIRKLCEKTHEMSISLYEMGLEQSLSNSDTDNDNDDNDRIAIAMPKSMFARAFNAVCVACKNPNNLVYVMAVLAIFHYLSLYFVVVGPGATGECTSKTATFTAATSTLPCLT